MSDNRCHVIELKCAPLSDGIAVGTVFAYGDILTRELPFYKISRKDIGYEIERITGSIKEVGKDLHKLSRSISYNIGTTDGDIFDAQRSMLEDSALIDALKKEIYSERINAEQITKSVFQKYIDKLSSSTHEASRAKADDLRGILRRVLRNLLGIGTIVLENLPRSAIVVTRHLLPSDTIRLDKQNAAGIVVEEGSVYSHSALLARSLAIPAVSTEGKSTAFMLDGVPIVIDGTEGKLFYNPEPSILRWYQEKRQSLGTTGRSTKIIMGPVKTKKGRPISIHANVSDGSDVSRAVSHGCDGIGLFRIESIYLESTVMPTEEDLYNILAHSLKPVGNRTVTIRVLDIGGDKRLSYFETGDQVSPFLGTRGIRLLLRNPELLLMQLRALVQLKRRFNIRVLLPMITLAEEVSKVREMLGSCYQKEGISTTEQQMQLGSMIETPAAVLSIRDIVKVSDFVSIGTNDLTQYIMAAGRESPEVASYYDKGVEHMFTLVRIIAKAAQRQGKECSICGELANDRTNVERFIQKGITHFSVSPYHIQELKKYVTGLEL
jgi:phosphotransferase system enzyme I (PtsI)